VDVPALSPSFLLPFLHHSLNSTFGFFKMRLSIALFMTVFLGHFQYCYCGNWTAQKWDMIIVGAGPAGIIGKIFWAILMSNDVARCMLQHPVYAKYLISSQTFVLLRLSVLKCFSQSELLQVMFINLKLVSWRRSFFILRRLLYPHNFFKDIF
jgi:hypothetical protein